MLALLYIGQKSIQPDFRRHLQCTFSTPHLNIISLINLVNGLIN
jgi:hypothetical protein